MTKKTVKRYPFNMEKHAHDLEFRRNRLFNVAMQMESEGKDATALWDEREKLGDLTLMYRPDGNIVWLTGEELNLAKKAVSWAQWERG